MYNQPALMLFCIKLGFGNGVICNDILPNVSIITFNKEFLYRIIGPIIDAMLRSVDAKHNSMQAKVEIFRCFD